ncbi:MAG: hypothetical protein RJB66_1356 [Pseudomonadota bacterium]|jgi:acyl-coenzyme A thioesterase PaaI-like protein
MIQLISMFADLFSLKKQPVPMAKEQFDFSHPIQFPFLNSDLHKGFVNSKSNDWGLQAEFFKGKEKTAYCKWERVIDPFQGFSGIIHGGILVTLADELMANCVLAHTEKFSVSLKATVKWHSPVKIGDAVLGYAQIISEYKNFKKVRFIIQSEAGKVVLSGEGLFYLPTQKQFNRMTGINLPPELQTYLRG